MSMAEERRERRRIAKRVAIRAVAVRLALEHGLEAATVEAIAEAADISPRTFFNYFATKDELFDLEPHQWTREEILAELRARPVDEAPLASMHAVVKAMAEAAAFPDLHGELELLQELYRRHPELYARIRLMDEIDDTMKALADEIAARTGTDADLDVRPGLLVAASFAAMQTAEQRARTSGRAFDEHLDEAFTLLRQGL
ncbi:TetR/AcrR family transcriptional regulator [Amycolatopsis minnesotensis]|uniref:TetR/AcrR family transcriptional regulator n=1 Tax=Amycolatopsis minnesotensis TaxID=337894 RepID=A0ABP5CV73_9PSEU